MATEHAQFVIDIIKQTVDNNFEKLLFLQGCKNHWEKWFQIELASALNRNQAQEIAIESVYRIDIRKKNSSHRIKYKTAQIDLEFRRRSESKGKLIGIELKQTNSIQGIKSMLSDIVKVRAIRSVEWTFREFYFVLFYYEDEIDRRKYAPLLKELLSKGNGDGLISTKLLTFSGLNNLRCLILYWDAGVSLNGMNMKGFQKWFTEEIKVLMKKYQLTYIAKGKPKTRSNVK